MTKIQILAAYERELGLLHNMQLKPKTNDSEYWINSGILEFVKTRFSGNNPKLLGFEQSQKRIDDLKNLVTEYEVDLSNNSQNINYSISLPEDYLFTVGETVGISSNDSCWPTINGIPKIKLTDVLETSIEEIDRERENSLSEYKLRGNRAKPLRLYIGNNIKLETDGNYSINKYILTYLKKPSKYTLNGNVFSEYDGLPEHTHQEFIKLAVRQFIENSGIPRYESYSNEINLME